ncbi:stAR-related lipid transfer protein 8 isoform X3 [Anolis sagrei]|uniref:stAR-related lipid transfer protein 8 isoform X3 n=1 Tax=Anolis sagrei TaxID=38937 RepID=UPI00352101E3
MLPGPFLPFFLPVDGQASEGKRMSHAEAEAKKACDWLRAAGFPQYAQLYEESLFPLDIAAVRKDHNFLDQDSLQSLCRRLMTLNSCASMKLEVHFQRKQNEELEEEDLCAISHRWAFQRDSKRWSRIGSDDDSFPCTLDGDPAPTTKKAPSQESILTDLSVDLEAASLHSDASTGSTTRTLPIVAASPAPTLDDPNPDLTDHSPTDPSPSLNGSSKEKPKKRRTRSFLKRIESLRRKDKEKSDSAKAQEEGEAQSKTPSKNDPRDPTIEKASLSTGCRTHQALTLAESKQTFQPKCGSVYLEDYNTDKRRDNSVQSGSSDPFRRDFLIHIPGDYKPGTFPKSLSIESLCPLQDGCLADWKPHHNGFPVRGVDSPLPLRKRRPSCGSTGSLYDNVPELGDEDNDPFDSDGEKIYENLDDILQHIWGLQQKVELWSQALRMEPGGDNLGEEETDSGGEPANGNFEERSVSDIGTSTSDFESTANSLNEGEDMEMRERRDSGVGASLTRPCRKLRWHSFQNSHRPSLNSASLEINRQSAAQVNLLQKCSLLCLTALMEKYSVPHKQTWAWTVPKFMKRSKTPDYKDKRVFGVPPMVNVQRTGQPLPQSIQQAMRYIRSQCLDQVGIFRKSGVKSRIQALRHMNEASPDNVNYEGQSAYDVADLLKQYFRDLPEPVFTNKLTETFLQIYQFVPKEQRLAAVQAAIVLMPDENREVLQTLLYFLSDIASAEENQMTCGNLAVCLAPSVFHLNASKKESTSPRMMHKRSTVGKPDHKDLSENMAATQSLSHMIADCKKLFQIPHEMLLQLCSSYVSAEAQPLSSLELKSPDELEASLQGLLKDSSERFKGWLSTAGPRNTELSCKKVGDGHPLRLWKVSTEVEAPPHAVLHRVLRERHLWDEDLLQGKVVEALDKNTEVYHYVTDSMAPHPRRDFVVLRKWRTDLPRGGCLLASASLDYKKLPLESGGPGGGPGLPVPGGALRDGALQGDPPLPHGSQRSVPRLVQQGLWPPVCDGAGQDPRLVPHTQPERTRDEDLKACHLGTLLVLPEEEERSCK